MKIRTAIYMLTLLLFAGTFSLQAQKDTEKQTKEGYEKAIKNAKSEVDRKEIEREMEQAKAAKKGSQTSQNQNTGNLFKDRTQLKNSKVLKKENELNEDETGQGQQATQTAEGRGKATGKTTGVEKTQARVVKTKAKVRETQSKVTSARELLDQARAKLESDRKAGIISQEAYDQKAARLNELESQIQRSQSRVDKMANQVNQ